VRSDLNIDDQVHSPDAPKMSMMRPKPQFEHFNNAQGSYNAFNSEHNLAQ